MPASRFERFLQLPGALARLFFAAMPILTAGAPSVANAGPHACVQWITDHQPAAAISGFAGGYFCVTMLLFVAGLRQALRPGKSAYSSAARAGGVADALADALMGWVTLASTEAADAESGAAVTARSVTGHPAARDQRLRQHRPSRRPSVSRPAALGAAACVRDACADRPPLGQAGDVRASSDVRRDHRAGPGSARAT
jgi:hypothetical protein